MYPANQALNVVEKVPLKRGKHLMLKETLKQALKRAFKSTYESTFSGGRIVRIKSCTCFFGAQKIG